MSLQTHQLAADWLADGVSAVVVVVLEARGSAPRDAGTRMIVSASHVLGTIGGGHLELKAIQHARTMLRGVSLPPMVHYPLGPALGQCCGGAVTLGFTPLDQQAMSVWPVPQPLFHLQLYGAGHVGCAIVRLLATLDVVVEWIDEREDEFPFALIDGAAWPRQIKTVCVDAVEDEVRHAPLGAYFLVLTHNHDLDMRITEAILQRAEFGYLGLIGSKTKRQRFMHRFEQRGFDADLLARMTCPIGIEGIDGKQPELIAVAVVAQLLQAHDALARHQAASERMPAQASREPLAALTETVPDHIR